MIKVNPSIPAQDRRKFSQVSARGLRRLTVVVPSAVGDATVIKSSEIRSYQQNTDKFAI
jgi:hypothetical protein